jgi:hypothetical protein
MTQHAGCDFRCQRDKASRLAGADLVKKQVAFAVVVRIYFATVGAQDRIGADGFAGKGY